MEKAFKRRIIAFDMDGTLLNEKKTISLRTRLYLQKLSKQGHIIVLASGRPSRALLSYYEQLKLKTPMICYNGAFVYNPTDDSFPKTEFRFPKEIVIEVLGRIKPHIKNIMCETDTDIWVDKEDQYLSKFFWYKDMNVHYGDLAKTLTVDPMTCIVQTPFEYRETKEVERELEKYEKINVRFWTGSPYFELFYEGTNKGTALVKICKYYGIPREDLIVFGDATNDVEMFEVAGTSVLMSNAKHDLKEKTTMVSVKDNDHNGIYHTLKKLLQ